MTTTATTQIMSTRCRSGRPRRFAVTTAATAAVAMLLPITSASADTPPKPSQTHCAANSTLTAVSDFADTVYASFVAGIDSPLNGGNGNGYVCVMPFNAAASTALDKRFPNLPPGSPIYLVGDDSIP